MVVKVTDNFFLLKADGEQGKPFSQKLAERLLLAREASEIPLGWISLTRDKPRCYVKT